LFCPHYAVVDDRIRRAPLHRASPDEPRKALGMRRAPPLAVMAGRLGTKGKCFIQALQPCWPNSATCVGFCSCHIDGCAKEYCPHQRNPIRSLASAPTTWRRRGSNIPTQYCADNYSEGRGGTWIVVMGLIERGVVDVVRRRYVQRRPDQRIVDRSPPCSLFNPTIVAPYNYPIDGSRIAPRAAHPSLLPEPG
jgi:hypothetical protein